jgi:uncharacterized membrane-anchored protein YitT (DUF2179 family)
MIRKLIKEYVIITIGTVLAAASIYFFMLPSGVTLGSASGLALILSHLIPLPISIITLIINIVLLLLGFLLVGRDFGAKTVYATILMPMMLGVYETVAPNFQSLTQEPILDVLCCILLLGAAQAVLFLLNASTGGLDIVAKIVHKYFKVGIGTALSVSGTLIALSSAFFSDTKYVVLGVLGTYLSGLIVDKFIFGLNIKRRVCVISQRIDDIVDFILHDLHSGATLYDGIGAYDGTVHREVVTIVDKNEYRLLMDFIKRVDPKAFVTVYSVNEVRYQPKTGAGKTEEK